MIEPNAHPSASLVKTLGIINIVVATLGLTIGLCCLDSPGLFASSFNPRISQFVKTAGAGATEKLEKRIKTLEQQEAEATSEKEKTELRRERRRMRTQLQNISVSFGSGLMDVRLDSPFYIAHFVVQLAGGLILNVLLLVSGIGLLRYAGWARKLSIAAAIGRIVLSVATTISYVGYVLPYIRRQTVAAAAAAKNSAAAVEAMMESNRLTHMIGAIIFMLLMIAYPIVTIVLLNLKGPRQLCRSPKPAIDPAADFDSAE